MKYKLSTSFSQSFLATIFIVNFCIFMYLAGYLKYSTSNSFDLAFSQYLQGNENTLNTFIMQFISFFGYPIPAVVSVLAVCYYLYKHKKPRFALLVSGVLLADSIGSFLKWFIGRARPTQSELNILTHESTQSFPSNHALHYTVFFGILMYLLERNIIKLRPPVSVLFRLSSFTLIIMVGISRVYLGVHWLSDVVGGYLLGSLFLIIFIFCVQKLKIKA